MSIKKTKINFDLNQSIETNYIVPKIIFNNIKTYNLMKIKIIT